MKTALEYRMDLNTAKIGEEQLAIIKQIQTDAINEAFKRVTKISKSNGYNVMIDKEELIDLEYDLKNDVK